MHNYHIKLTRDDVTINFTCNMKSHLNLLVLCGNLRKRGYVVDAENL